MQETARTDDQARELADGHRIPLLGLGVWQVPDGPECEHAVRWALELGYRHIDTAQAYGNEASVGRALRDSGVGREQVFLASTGPVVNQVQFSPFEYRRGLLEQCQTRRVALEAYSPLGTGRHINDPAVSQVAERVGRTPAQVLLRWCLQRDTIVISKSVHRERIDENAQIFDFSLSETDLRALDALDRTGATTAAREQKWW